MTPGMRITIRPDHAYRLSSRGERVADPVPLDLRSIVERSLPPGVRVDRAGKSSEQPAWWVSVKWRGQDFELWVRYFWLHDKRRDLIGSHGWIAVPAPEATLLGQRFWLRLSSADEVDDGVRYRFVVRMSLDHEEIPAVVEITRTARQILNNIAGPARRNAFEYELSAAIVVLKDHFKELVSGESVRIGSDAIDTIKQRARSSDSAVRRYVGAKLYQAYLGHTSDLTLTFTTRDLDYLGISVEDFQRAVSLADKQDWDVRALSIQPRKSFLQHMDSEAGETEAGGVESARVTAGPGDRRTVFICQ